jgi:hypothetical protein
MSRSRCALWLSTRWSGKITNASRLAPRVGLVGIFRSTLLRYTAMPRQKGTPQSEMLETVQLQEMTTND